MSIFVGLDCGGSSSRVLAVDSDGKVLFHGQSGAANLASTPEPRLARNLANATQGCPAADYVCGGFAGLVTEELRQKAILYLAKLFPGARVRAEPDYSAALFSCPDGTDVCVVSGTGSLVCSRDERGGVVKSGGRGYVLGDEGSGFQFGRDALIHYLNNPTRSSAVLGALVEETFGTTQEGEIIAQVYRSGAVATLLAKLSKAVVADAKAGESYAIESVGRNTERLAGVVRQHVESRFPGRRHLGVSLVGGTWKSGTPIRDRFEQHLRELFSGMHIELFQATRPPIYGAVELAKEMSHGN
jgi:glucosamine kinase